MKKRKSLIAISLILIFILTSLSGCGKTQDVSKMTPDDYEPEYYEFSGNSVNEDELADDTFYIVKKFKHKTRYYPIYRNCETSIEEALTEQTGTDPTRIAWVNYNIDEGLIPTMDKDDTLIYKSSTLIPSTYSLEKFYDLGYTFGIAGLTPDISGKYQYLSATSGDADGNGRVQTTSDAAGLDNVDAESIYFNKVDNQTITSSNVNIAGAISGLKLMKKYKCDIREGTVKDDVSLTANIRLFCSAENYMFSDFDFITPYIAKINLPEYATTGYYCINAGGFFKYNKDDSKNNNETIYTYDEYGNLNGALIDNVLKKFDDNGFIIDYEDKKSEDDDVEEKPVVARKKNENGLFGSTFYVSKVSKAKTNTNGKYYDIDVEDMNGTFTAQLRYYVNGGLTNDIKEGNSYKLEYLLENDDFGYGKIVKYELAQKNAERPASSDERQIYEEVAAPSNTSSVDISSIDVTDISKLKDIYNSLSDDQKTQVDNVTTSDVEQIKAIYNSLSDDQKQQLLNSIK